ncbi:hypothetical protein K469DRAFT_691718 [Zopfia rhizophila CBS 207.26]|uniref:RTA1 like protein n=1 Tax=Zopfia rhizophila CBS 207.26 TaxID=1314779 RepID=A0A6A6D4P2_9PEZI|nr:hypothetical protein K469DRAFT_691718 [Zopfia rhizophila CBS 207.26]
MFSELGDLLSTRRLRMKPELIAALQSLKSWKRIGIKRLATTTTTTPELSLEDSEVFVCGDVLAFLLQAGGGGMMAQSNIADLGQKVMLIGLFVQLLFFGFFLVISLVFWMRMRTSPTRFSIPQYGRYAWPTLLKLLLCAALIIIMRCVFRVVEFAQGHDGYLVSHEVFLYLFDTVPMLVVQAMFHFVRANDVFGLRAMRKLGEGDSYIELHESG